MMPSMAAHRWSDDDMLGAVRAAAAGHEGALTLTAYDAWRARHGGPSGIGIIRRFGKWSGACQGAGLDTVVTTTKKSACSEDATVDRKSGGVGKSVAVRVDAGGCRIRY